MNKKRLIVSCVVFLLVLGGIYSGYYYLSTIPATVDFTTISSAEVIEKASPVREGAVIKPADSLRLKKNTQYALRYVGKSDYSNGSLDFNTSDNMPIKPKPYYSEQKLSSLLNDQRGDVVLAVNNFLSTNSALYSIGELKLQHYGDWCGVKLVFNGEYSFQSDDIRLVLQKRNGAWTPATPAMISHSKVDYPDIPFDVLSSTNKL